MALSSTSLIHITDSLKNVCSILNEGFKLKYCFEKVESKPKNSVLEAAFPMVCFCDMPLSELKLQLSAYGKYGIGLTKEWGHTHKLNPVIYLDQHSRIVEELIQEFNLHKDRFATNNDDQGVYMLLSKIISFSKNYEGKLHTDKRRIDKYRFSDEREWRFVPSTEMMIRHHIPPFVDSKKYMRDKKNYNSLLHPIRVPLKPNDIKYLIVETENEIGNLIDYINKQNYKSHEKNQLISRIITFGQIESDM